MPHTIKRFQFYIDFLKIVLDVQKIIYRLTITIDNSFSLVECNVMAAI